MIEAALGFRVKSGWATAIVLSGAADSPTILQRRTVELSDPAVAGSRQPYHAVLGAPAQKAAELEQRLCEAVRSAAKQSLDRLVADVRQRNTLRRAGLVVGSVIDPSKIANEHIRAHALEGQLFRMALVDAADAHGLQCTILTERQAYAEAALLLERREEELKRAVADLGRTVDGSWKAEEKLAALAAWVALAGTKDRRSA